jgi:hypothetical protein
MTDSDFRSVPGQRGKTSAPTVFDRSPSQFPRSARPGESSAFLPFTQMKKSGQSSVRMPGSSRSGRTGPKPPRAAEDPPKD